MRSLSLYYHIIQHLTILLELIEELHRDPLAGHHDTKLPLQRLVAEGTDT